MREQLSLPRVRIIAALFAAGALALLLLVWQWPVLFPDRAADQRQPATMTTEDKRRLLHELSQSTGSEASAREKNAVLQAISDTDEEDQSLTTTAKFDILNSTNDR